MTVMMQCDACGEVSASRSAKFDSDVDLRHPTWDLCGECAEGVRTLLYQKLSSSSNGLGLHTSRIPTAPSLTPTEETRVWVLVGDVDQRPPLVAAFTDPEVAAAVLSMVPLGWELQEVNHQADVPDELRYRNGRMVHSEI